MPDYTLYYWPVPFRGQFIRALLAYAGKDWTEKSADKISALMEKEPGKQPIGFMGPPLLIDHGSDFAIAEMPAIALYLGETLGLLPESAELRALTQKVVNDANDVIDEITNDGGREMWTRASWKAFEPRLERWMAIWEALGRKHGLKRDGGFLLGGDGAGVADIVTATLWSTMTDRLPKIGSMLEDEAPRVAALVQRMQQNEALAALAAKSRKLYGDAYCGGKIEKSLRKAIGA